MKIGNKNTKFEIGDILYHKLNGKRYMISGIFIREDSFFYYVKSETLAEETMHEREMQEDKIITFDT